MKLKTERLVLAPFQKGIGIPSFPLYQSIRQEMPLGRLGDLIGAGESILWNYFELALSYKKHEYKNSIDSKAKSALGQLNK